MPLILFLLCMASAHGASFFEEPRPAHEILRRVVRSRGVAQPFKEDPRILQVEIGAANQPICADCVQVDKYVSQFDLFSRKEWEQTGERPPAAPLLRSLRSRNRSFPRTVETFRAPWAAARGGIIADALEMPFKDGAVGFLVSKCFPWFIPEGLDARNEKAQRRLIRKLLAEYQRVLAPGGAILLMGSEMVDRPGTELDRFWPHAVIAAELGFDAIPIAAPHLVSRRLRSRSTGRFVRAETGPETLLLVKRGSSCTEALTGIP